MCLFQADKPTVFEAFCVLVDAAFGCVLCCCWPLILVGVFVPDCIAATEAAAHCMMNACICWLGGLLELSEVIVWARFISSANEAACAGLLRMLAKLALAVAVCCCWRTLCRERLLLVDVCSIPFARTAS